MDNHDRKPPSGRPINRREFLALATRTTGAAMALGATLDVRSAFAQPAPAYPTKPIRLIIGFSAGGGADAFARLVGTYLEAKLGQPIVIDNRAGANGKIANDYVASQPADGYTLLLSTSSATVVAPYAWADMKVHPVRDLTPITLACESEFVLLTNPSLEAKTFAEFVALAKKKPGEIVHGSPGLGSANHVAGELLQLRTGISMNTIHYKGSAPIMTELLANRVNLTIASAGLAQPYIESKRLGALMAMSKERLPTLPNVPSSVELGIKDLDQIKFWLSLHGPKGTPKPVVDKIRDALVDVYKIDTLKAKMAEQGLKPVANTPAEFSARMESELKLYGDIFKKANIKVES
jgi:tripartite-type tricarboxylate transporter receptor subunit TctC